jgi:hypothetical protein
MPSPLESATDDRLDPITVAHLGDTFTYTPAGGQPVTGVNGFVEYEEDVANPQAPGAGAVAQVIVIELLASLFPTRPDATCRVTDLARYPGVIWQPIAILASDRNFWRFSIKKVAA